MLRERNIDHLTTEQVAGKPIKDEAGLIVGYTIAADEEWIYWVLTGYSRDEVLAHILEILHSQSTEVENTERSREQLW